MRYRFPLSALALAAAPIFASAADTLKVPFEYHKLDNGLKVVLSKDTTAPTATVTVYYNIGFRIEPKGRTGFAHLFEHLMFQGSNLRESKGYTYSPFSQVSNRYRDATWAQNADVTTAVTGASLKEIFYEIDRLQAETPTEAELESAKNYMLGTFVLRNSDRFGIIAQLEFINFHGLPADYLNTYIGKGGR